MYLYTPYKQFSTTKVLPLQMVPISGLAQGLVARLPFLTLADNLLYVNGCFQLLRIQLHVSAVWEMKNKLHRNTSELFSFHYIFFGEASCLRTTPTGWTNC